MVYNGVTHFDLMGFHPTHLSPTPNDEFHIHWDSR